MAIIGAGFSGIAAAIALRKRGIDDFIIFEKFDGIGGTWWSNRYPGAEVDLESHIYSFSFERWDWTRTHAYWDEVLAYLTMVARKWDLDRHVHLKEKVESAVWSDTAQNWTITTASGLDHGTFDAVISAVGFLNIPLIPPFARIDNDYEGVLCHTATWPEGVDMAGKSVAVLGTGSSAVQVVTEAVRDATSVTIFQIEPNWILPKGSRAFTSEERRQSMNPLIYRWRRAALYLDYDRRQMRSGHARRTGRMNRKRREDSIEFARTSLAGRPDLLALSTPGFPFEGRRTVITDTYYPALKDAKVKLVPHAATELTRTGLIDANGDAYDVDLIVLATGFDAANYLSSFEVRGENGQDLQKAWQGEPDALLGMMVPGFPNFFMMYGPNTNAVPLVTFYEAQASFASSLIARLGKGGKRVIRVKPEAYRRFNEWLQGKLADTVWAETESYFTAHTGKVVSQWPISASAYILATKWARRRWVDVT